jgi:hypothetical protein
MFLAGCTVLAIIAAIVIPTNEPDHDRHLNYVELAIVPGGTLSDG